MRKSLTFTYVTQDILRKAHSLQQSKKMERCTDNLFEEINEMQPKTKKLKKIKDSVKNVVF